MTRRGSRLTELSKTFIADLRACYRQKSATLTNAAE